MDVANVRVFAPYVAALSKNNEWRAYCPIHEDPRTSKTPSASFNFNDDVWHCAGCGEGGSITSLRKKVKKADRYTGPHKIAYQTILSKLDKTEEYSEAKPLPSMAQLKKWNQDLLANPYCLQAFQAKRGLTLATIKKYLLGWDGMRYTIPVWDADGNLVNVRRYKITKVSANKMVNLAGHGEVCLMGHEVIAENDKLVLCEGELDYITARQRGIPAFTHTGGAHYWNDEWSKLFEGKEVYIAYDDDRQGRLGAINVAKALHGIAADVLRVKLNTGIGGGDLTDFFTRCELSKKDWLDRVAAARSIVVAPDEPAEMVTTGVAVSMEESFNMEHVDENLEVQGVVIGSMSTPYLLPIQVTATCQLDAGAACANCPMAAASGKQTLKLDRMDPSMMDLTNINKASKERMLRKRFGARCRRVNLHDDEMSNLEVMFVRPVLDFETKEESRSQVVRTVYNLGTHHTNPNEQVRLVGRQSPTPEKQGHVLYTWSLTSVNNELDNFKMTPQVYRRLKKFQPKPGVEPLLKCKRIANDIAKHTGIIDRTLMHVAMDLVWHSLIAFEVDGQMITKGWLEGMIIGDTRTGKSKCAEQLMAYYRLGSFVSCETTTFAGLVGGSDKVNDKSWVVKWGVIPQNDMRMVVLDEFSGMKESNIIERMSGIRSNGVAQISAISGDHRAAARTRLLWMTNPHQSNGMLKDSPKGMIPALRTLIPSPEDQARFDFVMGVSADEVNEEKINKAKSDKAPRIYRSADCRLLLLWAWSRTADDVSWDQPATHAMYSAASKLGKQYVSDPPLVQAANVREKIARIAVALAARTFSTDVQGNKVKVKAVHVHAAVQFLTEVYGAEPNGYADYSTRLIEAESEAQQNLVATRKLLKANQLVVEALASMDGQRFTIRDLEDAGMDRSEATDLARHLIRLKMVTRRGRFFHTSRHLNDVIKGMG